MSDFARVKANIATMINKGAPESDIDAYVASEGVSLGQLQGSASPTPSQASPTSPPHAAVGAWGEGAGNVPPIVPLDGIPNGYYPAATPPPGGAPSATPAPGRDAEIAQAQAEASKLLRAGKEKEALALLAQHRLQLPDGELDAFHAGKRSAGFTFNGKHREDVQPGGLRHDLDYYGDQIRHGAGDIVDAPANIADLLRSSGNWLKGNGFQSNLDLPEWARPGTMANEAMDQAEKDSIGYVPSAANGPQRYAGQALRFVTGSAVPAAKLAGLGKARAALATLSSAITGAVGGEGAHDIAPALGVDPEKARMVGQIVGSVAGGLPSGAKPLSEARFVSKQATKNPYAAYDAEIAQELHGLTTKKARSPTDPKGRAVVSVNEVNDLERSYTTGFKTKIAALDIPTEQKRALVDALEQDHSISTEKLDALRGTPEGDAVATGIIKAQRLRALTPEVKRAGGMVTVRRVAEILGTTLGAIQGGPIGAPAGLGLVRLAMRRGTEAEAARVHSAQRVIQRAPLYDKVAAKVGPSGQLQAYEDLNQKYADTVSARQSAQDAAAQARQDAASARADQQAQARADRQAKADSKASRHGMTDKEYASYSTRSASADAALKGEPVPTPRTKTAQSALDKYNKAATAGSSKLSDFDAKLNEAPQAPKVKSRKAEDVAIENNMDQGLKGYHRAYADAVSAHLGVTVEPADVLGALKRINTDDIDPFELRKFQMEHRVSPAAKAALLPRLEKVLRADSKVMGRTAPAETTAAKPTTDAPTKGAPTTPNYDQQMAQATDVADPELRKVVRPADYERGASAYIARADAKIASIKSDPEIPGGRRDEVVNAAESVKRDHKTKESARRWIDFEYLPQLEAEGVDPNVIDRIQKHLHEVADVGKKHGTQAELDAATKRRPRGRPVKASDDVPF